MCGTDTVAALAFTLGRGGLCRATEIEMLSTLGTRSVALTQNVAKHITTRETTQILQVTVTQLPAISIGLLPPNCAL